MSAPTILHSDTTSREEPPGIFLTETEFSEQQFRDAATRFRSLFENAVEGIYQSTPEGQYLMVNPALARMYGYESVEALLSNVSDIQHQVYVDPGFRERFKSQIEQHEQIRGLEYQVRRRDGRRIWISESARAVRDTQGMVRYYEGFIEDITLRKEAEAALRLSQQQLVETSRQVGMAEVATGILHNVGNALNSVNVSANLVSAQLKHSKVDKVGRVAALLREHASDLASFLVNDPKGKHLPHYLEQLGEHLAQEQAAVLKEMEALRKSVEHTNEIIAAHQSYAKVSGLTETISVDGLIDDALRLNASMLARCQVRLVREVAADLPEVTIQKHKVLQILVNLVSNAIHACDASGGTDKRLTVSARTCREGKRIRISVIDTGIGISWHNLTRIFNYGFTTRKGGHGFGLHSAALAAREIGGTLTAHSDGPGTGATFRLEFPCRPEERRS